MQLTKLAVAVRRSLVATGVAWMVGYGAPGYAQAAPDAAPAGAQTSAPPTKAGKPAKPDGDNSDDTTVTELGAWAVTGQLPALQPAQSIKQDACNVVDASAAEEAFNFPDPNV